MHQLVIEQWQFQSTHTNAENPYTHTSRYPRVRPTVADSNMYEQTNQQTENLITLVLDWLKKFAYTVLIVLLIPKYFNPTSNL